MTNKHFLSGIPAILLAFGLVFTACENPATEVEGTVGISSQKAPSVTATVVKGGVMLEWEPAIAASYSVYRETDDVKAIKLDDNFLIRDKATGKFRYFDLVSDTNPLIADTEYKYTVIAYGQLKTIGETTAKAKLTATDIPAKGTKLAPVSGVKLTLSPENNEISVSWTIPEKDVPARYSVQVKDTSSGRIFSGNASVGETSVSILWDQDYQTDGEYKAMVVAQANTYFESSVAVSAGTRYEALFGSTLYVSIYNTPITTGNTITGFAASISLDAKPEVTYTVERAPADAAGNAGTYAAVSLYKSLYDTTSTDWKADILGNLPSVYDKNLGLTAGTYKYRVTAKKGSVTQTRETTVTLDPRKYISVSSIAIGTPTSANNVKTYQVTPSLTYKGALQAGDKLVIYYVKGDDSSVYQTGPYTQSIEFSKGDLEATAVLPKSLSIPKVGNDYYAYVQAYIVFADGRAPKSVITYSNTTGDGVNSIGSYDSIYYAELDY